MENQSGALWKIRLFGGPILESSHGDGQIQHQFRSVKVAALLGYLALRHGKPCSRESLIEALWPDETDSAVLANRFRVTLASLRRQLEPSGFPFGMVLDTSVTGCILLRDDSTWCDLTAFNEAFRSKDLETASQLLSAPLLPGMYDDWAHAEQVRIELLLDELKPIRDMHSPTLPTTKIQPATLHRLPLFLTRYLARETEIDALIQLIDKNRLVTITGPGGVGKTRISVEACERSGLPTVFIPLADCTDLDGVCEVVVRSLNVAHHLGPDALQQVTESLNNLGPCRLLLDNADHIVDDVAKFAQLALQGTPQLSIVVTSRQAIEVDGEQIFRLDPMEVPVRGSLVSVVDLDIYPSTRLFLDRVRQSRPDFVAKEQAIPQIVEICRKLEGLPLAIELAAAQITIHSVGEILNSLESSLIDLKSRRRSLSTRHHSLRAALQSSLDGLEPSSALFLAKLSVFWGGWTAETAAAVTGDHLASDRLEDLALKSLIHVVPDDDATRFTFLEAVRQLAQEQLGIDDFAELEARHRAYFFKLASQVDEEDLRSLAPLDAERFNLVAAYTNADATDPMFWRANRGSILHAFIRGEHRSAVKWIREFRSQLSLCSNREDRREWCNAALQVLTDVGLYAEAEDILQEMRTQSEEASDQIGIAYACLIDGLMSARQNDISGAIDWHREAYDRAKKLRIAPLYNSALAHLSGSLHEIARKEGADSALKMTWLGEAEELACELITRVGNESRRLPLAHLLAGVAAYYQDKIETAQGHFNNALESAERLGIRSVTMYVSYFEAEIAGKSTDFELAEAKRTQFRDLHREIGIVFGSQSLP